MHTAFIKAEPSEKQFVHDLLRNTRFRENYAGQETFQAMREATARLAEVELAPRIPAGVVIEPVTVDGVSCERFTPPFNANPEQMILFLHGGGYVRGSLAMGRLSAAQLAVAVERTVVAIGYRQGPEHRFPAASEDLLTVYRAVIAGGARAQDIVVVGESAGGTMALVLPTWLRNTELSSPAGLVGLSPMADLRMRGAAWLFNAERDFATIPMGQKMLSFYADDADLDNVLMTPVAVPVAEGNQILLCVGSHETMLSDVEWYAHLAEAARNTVTLNLYEAMPHGFTRFDLPIARQVFVDIGEWCKQRLG